ncbi:TetR/AcrR family transcriptional regulator [Pedomonas mirosovicensis]|uniref:TetR/AcrR family transcriptional regulator n=1 Tax=Pedomonas mirosovicensis TaxID=2908641 RepID=UPI00216A91B8|nr:TetR family transcriptional regulator [Pedomonas mirosovicensis]MCH8686440.1 TetR family transcriptional regulator [Pedomonas mirosovicensis]
MTARPAATNRYNARKETVLAAAVDILNQQGVRGVTFAEVAGAVGLTTTSVAYYFPRKEDLVSACMVRAVERWDAMIEAASAEPTPAARLETLIRLYLENQFLIRAGEAPPMARFDEVRALRPPHAGVVRNALQAMVRRLRGLMEGPEMAWAGRRGLNARANLVLEQLLWSVVWIEHYDAEDAPRLAARLLDALLGGIARPGAAWTPQILTPALPDTQDSGADAFLMAATRLINEIGYRGASVARISESLNVTKGAFYHHNDAKDDLVIACFERTFEITRQTQLAASALESDGWTRLTTAAASLVAFQLSEQGPLMRASALSVLPDPLRRAILADSGRVSRRFASMISDGIADGSLRAVDPLVASEMLYAGINSVLELVRLVPDITGPQAIDLYLKPTLYGLFTRLD